MPTIEFLFDAVKLEEVRLREDAEGNPVIVWDVVGVMNSGDHRVGLARCPSHRLASRLKTWWERQTMAGDHF